MVPPATGPRLGDIASRMGSRVIVYSRDPIHAPEGSASARRSSPATQCKTVVTGVGWEGKAPDGGDGLSLGVSMPKSGSADGGGVVHKTRLESSQCARVTKPLSSSPMAVDMLAAASTDDVTTPALDHTHTLWERMEAPTEDAQRRAWNGIGERRGAGKMRTRCGGGTHLDGGRLRPRTVTLMGPSSLPEPAGINAATTGASTYVKLILAWPAKRPT